MLIGLGTNIILMSTKGAAGWLMNSAALLADAGHSLSGEYDHKLVTYHSPFFSAVTMCLQWENPLSSHMHPAS